MPASRCSSSTASTSDGRRRHRDDVGAERLARKARDHPEGVEHVPHFRRRVEVARNQRAAAFELRAEKSCALLLAPFRVRAQAERARHRVERGRVARGVLTDVEPHQRQPERGQPAQDVGEPALGDDAVAGGAQRAIAELERRFSSCDVEIDRLIDDAPAPDGGASRPLARSPSGRSSIASAQRRVAIRRSRTSRSTCAVGLVRSRRPARAARRCSSPSTARRAARRSRGSRDRPPSSAPSRIA